MLCSICGRFEVASEDENTNFCMICGTQGRQFERWLSEEVRSFLLPEIRELPGVSAAEISGGSNGNFRLIVGFTDREEILEVIAGTKNDDHVFLQPAIPPVGHPWGIGIVEGAPNWSDFSELRFKVVQDVFDDEEIVQAIAVMAEGGSLESKEVEPQGATDAPRMALGFVIPEAMIDALEENPGYEEMISGSPDDPGITAQVDQYLAQALDAVRDSANGKRRWVVMCENEDGLIALSGRGPETQVDDGEFAMACSLTLIKGLRKFTEEKGDDDEQE